jgi:hypothetical protein
MHCLTFERRDDVTHVCVRGIVSTPLPSIPIHERIGLLWIASPLSDEVHEPAEAAHQDLVTAHSGVERGQSLHQAIGLSDQAPRRSSARISPLLHKTPSLLNVSLCLSRACLGNTISFSRKWRERCGFRTRHTPPATEAISRTVAPGLAPAGGSTLHCWDAVLVHASIVMMEGWPVGPRSRQRPESTERMLWLPPAAYSNCWLCTEWIEMLLQG